MGQPFFMRIQKIFKQLIFFIAKFGNNSKLYILL